MQPGMVSTLGDLDPCDQDESTLYSMITIWATAFLKCRDFHQVKATKSACDVVKPETCGTGNQTTKT
jgi:hypothetical protein